MSGKRIMPFCTESGFPAAASTTEEQVKNTMNIINVLSGRYYFKPVTILVIHDSTDDKNPCVCQGLEYDIVAQGPTVKDTLESWDLASRMQSAAYIEIRVDPLKMVQPASIEYWIAYVDYLHRSRVA